MVCLEKIPLDYRNHPALFCSMCLPLLPCLDSTHLLLTLELYKLFQEPQVLQLGLVNFGSLFSIYHLLFFKKQILVIQGHFQIQVQSHRIHCKHQPQYRSVRHRESKYLFFLEYLHFYKIDQSMPHVFPNFYPFYSISLNSFSYCCNGTGLSGYQNFLSYFLEW